MLLTHKKEGWVVLEKRGDEWFAVFGGEDGGVQEGEDSESGFEGGLSEAEQLTTALGLESAVMEEQILGKFVARAKRGDAQAAMVLLAAQHNRWQKHLAQETSRVAEVLEDIGADLEWLVSEYEDRLDESE